jgi:hypothetical protein
MRRRSLINPGYPTDVDPDYALLVARMMNTTPWIARSVVFDGPPFAPQIVMDLRVHPFICPDTEKERYAIVADGPGTILIDFPARRHALRYYRDLVKTCQDDPNTREGDRPHAWDVTDIPGVPMNKGATTR